MNNFINYIKRLDEERLSQEKEDLMSFKKLSASFKDAAVDIKKLIQNIPNAIIDKFCEISKQNADEFKKKHPKVVGLISKKFFPYDLENASFIPFGIVYYSSTDVYMAAVYVSTGNFFSKIIGHLPALGMVYNKITNNIQQGFLFPVKFNSNDLSVKIDSSPSALGQMAMTFLLSDLDFKVVWPVKFGDGKVGNWIMKTLDFICPSLVDIIPGLHVWAGRAVKAMKWGGKTAAKLAVKTGAKAGAKAAAKTGTKNIVKKGVEKIAKKGLKATTKSKKLLKKIPGKYRKTLSKAKNGLKKKNKVSREFKSEIRNINTTVQDAKQVYDNIRNMGTDDLYSLIKTSVGSIIKNKLPDKYKDKIDALRDKIPDKTFEKLEDYIKSSIKKHRNEDDDKQTTAVDVVKTLIPDNYKEKLGEYAEQFVKNTEAKTGNS